MKLNEVLRTKMKLDDYIEHLTKEEKVELLGRGFAGHVFQHPTMKDVAVKVVHGDDENYLKFARWAKKNSHNPFVPKIHGIENVVDDDGDKYVIIFMEKLQSMSLAAYKRFVEDDLGADAEELTGADIEIAARETEDGDLRQVLKFLLKFDDALDLHDDNFMLRGKQVVFTDPLAV